MLIFCSPILTKSAVLRLLELCCSHWKNNEQNPLVRESEPAQTTSNPQPSLRSEGPRKCNGPIYGSEVLYDCKRATQKHHYCIVRQNLSLQYTTHLKANLVASYAYVHDVTLLLFVLYINI